MHRLLVPTEQLAQTTITLSAENARHLKVLRPRKGEKFELFDGCGSARVFRYDGELSSAGAIRKVLKSPWSITLFACVTKGSRWDWTIEKATELGVSKIVPVISARTIVRISSSERDAKVERWQKIAEEAARQSDAMWVPEISAPISFENSLSLVRDTRCLVGALLRDGGRAEPIAAAIDRLGLSESMSVYVGPEGDFSDDELFKLLQVAHPVSFGETILRAETAAIFAVAALKSAIDAQIS